ncbi:hypothetical protein M569_12066, partial [Genlisea aurea]
MKKSAGDDNGDAIPLLEEVIDVGGDSLYRHSSLTGSTSFFKTCFNGLNALSGVGILSIPYALASGGWLSLSLFFLIAACTYCTALIIQKCMDMDPTIKTFPDIGLRAFGPRGKALVSLVMNVELFMVATGFLVLEGDNLHNLFPDVGYQIGGFSITGKQTFVILVGLVMLPAVSLDSMSILSYISATGVAASFVLIASIFWAASLDGVGFREKGVALDMKGIPTAVSLYAFCYCAHPVFPTLYISTKDQKKFSKVLLVCFLVCTASYASVAILGYLMFGDRLESQITLNLPLSKMSSRVAIYTTLVNPLAKYALMVKPIVCSLESRFVTNPNWRALSISLRSCLVVSTVAVAISIPFFGDLMSFVGAFLSVSASVIIPCLCFLKISGIYRRFGLELTSIWGILAMGFFILVVGTYTSVRDIV